VGLVCEADNDAELKLSPLYQPKGRVGRIEEGDSDPKSVIILGPLVECGLEPGKISVEFIVTGWGW